MRDFRAQRGAVSYLDMVGVTGSNPVSPTTRRQRPPGLIKRGGFFHARAQRQLEGSHLSRSSTLPATRKRLQCHSIEPAFLTGEKTSDAVSMAAWAWWGGVALKRARMLPAPSPGAQ